MTTDLSNGAGMGKDSVVDAAAIYAALDQERRARGNMSWRQVAHEAEVSPSTLSRMAQGYPPALDGLVRLADWAGMTLDELVGRASERIADDVSPPTAIASYLRTRKDLSPQAVEALEAIVQAAYDKLRLSAPET
jgi:transcriptional regulator with XRE-family HTH domain